MKISSIVVEFVKNKYNYSFCLFIILFNINLFY